MGMERHGYDCRKDDRRIEIQCDDDGNGWANIDGDILPIDDVMPARDALAVCNDQPDNYDKWTDEECERTYLKQRIAEKAVNSSAEQTPKLTNDELFNILLRLKHDLIIKRNRLEELQDSEEYSKALTSYNQDLDRLNDNSPRSVVVPKIVRQAEKAAREVRQLEQELAYYQDLWSKDHKPYTPR